MTAKKNNGSVLLKLGLVLVVLAAAGYFTLQRLQGTARVKLVKRDNAVDAVTGTVIVDADGGTRTFRSEAPGRVVLCEAIDPAARFREGDVLVVLDSSELKRALDQAERQYVATKERARFTLTGGKPELLAEAKSLSDEERERIVHENFPLRKQTHEKLSNAQRLLKIGNVSDEDVRILERALAEIDRGLKEKLLDEKRAEQDFIYARNSAELQIKKMTITAPSDGQIESALTWKGALINDGHVVATWFSNTRVVAAKISEESFGKVKLGQKARLRLLTYGRQEFDATVSKLLPKADDAQRFTVFLDVNVDPDQLKPLSTGEVTITVEERADQLMIPRRALFDSDKVSVVKDGRVERRKVEVGFLALTVAEVRKGLEVGEQVIVDNPDTFRPGQRVRIEVVN